MSAPAAQPAGPAAVAEISAELCEGLEYFFTDIDDTLTAAGLIPAGSFSAMWRLAEAGIRVVPVTGRPAGWCDHIARMWPVAGVVGENGALCYAYDRERRLMRRSLAEPELQAPRRKSRLARVARRVLREVPGSALAADQPFRISDIAIDYREDVAPLPPQAVQRICEILGEEGVRFKVSSIHVNFWLGDFDKMSGVRRFLADRGQSLEEAGRRAVFIGDSPNDEPLFGGFPHSVAVGNLRRFLPDLAHPPQFITQADSAQGFQEAVAEILRKRRRT